MRQFANLRTLLCMVIIMGIGMMLPSCKSEEKKEMPTPSFKVMELKGTKVPVYLQMVGKVEGIPTVEIRARVAGYLENW